MPRPGFEPGLPRPQRGVLTTRRSRLVIRVRKVLLQSEVFVKLHVFEGVLYQLNLGNAFSIVEGVFRCTEFLQILFFAQLCTLLLARRISKIYGIN